MNKRIGISLSLLSLSVVIALVIPLYAAMSLAGAKAKAVSLWGPAGMIGDEQYSTANDYTRQVGVHSGGCARTFTVLGSGFSTWDAAFADYGARLATGKVLIGGPLKGIVLLKVEAWDDVGVAGFQYFVDSKPWGPELVLPVAPRWNSTTGLDTSQLANGFHVLCSQARDEQGNIGYSEVWLFRTDQNVPLTQARPSISTSKNPVVIP